MLLGAALTVSGTSAAANSHGDPILGDLDRDGLTDRATLVLDSDMPNCQADFEKGLAGGGYRAAVRKTIVITGGEYDYCPDMGVAVDLGADGVTELVLTWFNGSPLPGVDIITVRNWVRIGGVPGQFQPSRMGVADFDGNGLVDVWQATDQGEGVSTFLNRPDSTLVRGPAQIPADLMPRYAFGDVDKDGGTDIVAAADGVRVGTYGENWVVLVNGRTGAYTPLLWRASMDVTPALRDVNADGWLDVVASFEAASGLPATTWLNDRSGRLAQVPLLSRTFSTSASGMTKISGGTWTSTGGQYRLTKPASTSAPGNSNLSVGGSTFAGDVTVGARAAVAATSSTWNDFSLVFGFRDAANYYYVSFNEANDANTSGIFKVKAGVVTQLADITALIAAGRFYEVGVDVADGRIRAYRNKLVVASVAYEPDYAGGKVGVGSRNDAATFDDLSVRRGAAVPVVQEQFTDADSTFVEKVSGGTWSVRGGRYSLTAPVTDSAPGNSNLAATVERSWAGSYAVSARALVTPTAGAWDDFSVVFGYSDPRNYFYASFNESNDARTSGLFQVRSGKVTQLADVASAITAGTWYTIRIERGADQLRVYRNNSLQATATVTAAVEGRVGVGSRDDAATFDDLVVTPAV